MALGATSLANDGAGCFAYSDPGIFSIDWFLGRAVGAETMKSLLMATSNTAIMDWNIFRVSAPYQQTLQLKYLGQEVGSTHYQFCFSPDYWYCLLPLF